MSHSSPTSPILDLPVEIHLNIFQHCLLEGDITIGSCPALGDDDADCARIPGLTPGFVPATAQGFDRALLESGALRYAESQSSDAQSSTSSRSGSGSFSPTVHGKAAAYQLPSRHLYPTMPSLHLTCRQIHEELRTHRSLELQSARRSIDLYLSYPDGVCVAVHQYPHLLRMARSVNIAGMCDLTNIQDPGLVKRCDRRWEGADQSPISLLPGRVTPSKHLEIEQINALEILVDQVLGQRAIQGAERSMDEQEPEEGVSGMRSTLNSQTVTPGRMTDQSQLPRPTPSRSQLSIQTSFPSTALSAPASAQRNFDSSPTDEPTTVKMFSPSTTSPNLSTLNLRIFHPNPYERPAPAAPSQSQSSSPTATRITPRPNRANLHPQTTSNTSPNTNATPSAIAMSQDPYSLLWSHSLSPATATLSCIHGGDINLSVARGRKGNGIEIVAKANHGNGRCVSCSWPRLLLDEGDIGGLGWLVPKTWGQDLDNLEDCEDVDVSKGMRKGKQSRRRRTTTFNEDQEGEWWEVTYPSSA